MLNLSKYTVLARPGGNFIASLKDVSNDIYFFWEQTDRIDFKEMDTPETEKEDCVIRIFKITNQSCNIQFRATQSLKKGTKKRNLIATAFLSKEDLKYILTKMGGY